jgi:mono/diheme cytochrome c family protein
MSRRALQWICLALLVVVLAFAAFLVWAHQPALPPIAARPAFSPELVSRGAELAQVGDCQGCHTVTARVPYAGGAAIRTPLGRLFGSNITPDPATGIGRWSRDAFARALREGISADGRQLYPGMPYEHFASVSDDDVNALYAFLMSQNPVHAIAPANRLVPPVNYRPFLAAWKKLFAHKGGFVPPPRPDPVWNRGAYLAEGLAHCGACHTPRTLFQAEDPHRPLAGGWADGWATPPLDGSGARWTAGQVETYLTTGRAPDGKYVRGPMVAVVKSLAPVPRSEVHAIAVYMASRMQAAPHAR